MNHNLNENNTSSTQHVHTAVRYAHVAVAVRGHACVLSYVECAVWSTSLYILYVAFDYVESNSVLCVADGDITFNVSPTRRGAPRKDVRNEESPTKRLHFP